MDMRVKESLLTQERTVVGGNGTATSNTNPSGVCRLSASSTVSDDNLRLCRLPGSAGSSGGSTSLLCAGKAFYYLNSYSHARYNTDGSEVPAVPLPVSSLAACRRGCESDKGCTAFDYVEDGAQDAESQGDALVSATAFARGVRPLYAISSGGVSSAYRGLKGVCRIWLTAVHTEVRPPSPQEA